MTGTQDPLRQPRAIRAPTTGLVVVLVAYGVLATWYSVTIPLGEAPDEVPHFTYVRYLAQHRRLPDSTEEHEAFQPPLYYALGAALTFWIQDEADALFAVRANADFDVTDPRAPKNLLLHSADEAWPYRGWALAWHLVRLLSVAMGATTVWAIFRLGYVLFPAQPVIPLTMAGLTAFTPQFLFMSAVANNDNAATSFSALILWQVVALLNGIQRPVPGMDEALKRPQIWGRVTMLGFLLGLGILSKASLIALIPIVAIALVVAAGQDVAAERLSRPLRVGVWFVLVFGIAGLITGWYFLRNWISFGDPLGWSFLLEINARREGPLTWDVLAWLFRGVFRSFWLGWIGIEFAAWIYWVIAVICLVGLAGFLCWLVRGWSLLNRATHWSLILLGLHAAITFGSLIQWTATVLGTDQGRLIFPILPTVALMVVAGWVWLSRGRMWHWAPWGLVIGMLSLALVTPILYIAPVHAPAPVATDAELAAATPLNVDWDSIRLLGYRLEDNQVAPGGKLVLHLYWQALQPVERDLMVLLQLVDEDGRFLMYTDGSPTAGRDTTDRWTPGVALASQHLLPVPDYGTPGEYQLTVSCHPFGDAAWIPATGPDGMSFGDHLILPDTIHLVAP